MVGGLLQLLTYCSQDVCLFGNGAGSITTWIAKYRRYSLFSIEPVVKREY